MTYINKHLLLIFIIACNFILTAQEIPPSGTLNNPYQTIYHHLYWLNSDHYDASRAGEVFVDVEGEDDRASLAKQLKHIYDAYGLYVNFEKLPVDGNYLDSTTKQQRFVPFPDKFPSIYLQKYGDQWLYSEETVYQIPLIFKNMFPFGMDNILEYLPEWSRQKIMGLYVYQILGLLLFLLIAVVAFKILSWLLRPVVNGLTSREFHLNEEAPSLISKMARALSLLIVGWLFILFIPVLLLPINLSWFIILMAKIFISVIIAVLIFRIIEGAMVYAKVGVSRTENKMDDQILPVIERVLKVIVIILAFFYILSLMNVNVAALIAGLSIGGLALALAAQDAVKNLIGSVMIFMDKPFQINDFIVVEEHSGVVTEVGFRSTRIRTKDTSIIAIPNGIIANSAIKNLGVRVYRLFETELGITYNSTPEEIKEFVKAVEKMVIHHPQLADEEYFVHLNKMGDSSLKIMFRVYMLADSYAAELILREEILLNIIHLAEAVGVEFAFPSQSIYLESVQENKKPGKSSVEEVLRNMIQNWETDENENEV